MKAMALSGRGQAATLIEQELPMPEPGAGELLIRVFAAGVTPTELLWYPTTHTRAGEIRNGAVPAHEFSGEIAQIGEGVEGYSTRQEVYGMNDWFDDGALAEYCLTRPDWIALKPRTLSYAESASVPIGALTAWQGLFNRAKLEPGERVLVHGGAGAVGIFAVQLAHLAGAHVTATVSAHNLEFVKELGAEHAVDYRSARFEDEVRDVDVVFDTVGGETLVRSWGVLKPNGRMVTVAADGDGPRDERSGKAFFIVEPNREQLIEVGRRIDAGELHPVLDAVVPFSRAANAFAGTARKIGRGRIVATVADSRSGPATGE
jgi:NADPH:quinone reductase-like Zn-dependent oxidoreductase